MAEATGHARIRHSETKEIYEIPASDIDLEVVSFEDRQMGPEYLHQAQIHHPELGELLWMVWEYPIGAENYRETNVGPHELLEDVQYNFDADGGEWENEEVARLSPDERQARIDAMVEWFFANYEDPAHRTPYEGREGGYQWIWGGPFDAREELYDNFSDEHEELIEAAVAEIESDGLTEWTRTPRPEDYGQDEDDFDVVDDRLARELQETIDALPLVPGAVDFDFGQDGLIHLITPGGQPAPSGNEQLLSELRATAGALVEALAGTNGHPNLLAAARHYLDGLPDGVFTVSLIYARGIRLENAASSARNGIQAGDLPSFTTATEQNLESTLELHAAYVMSTEEGRGLVDGAKAFQKPAPDTEALLGAMNDIRGAIDAAPKLFADDVRSYVGQVISEAGTGPHPDRSTQAATKTVGQLAIRVLGIVAATGLSTLLINGLGASVPAAAATNAITAGANAAWYFLLSNAQSFWVLAGALGADTNWATPMAHIFERLRHIRIGGDQGPVN